MEEREKILRHLNEDYTEPIRDPLWRHIHLSPGLRAVAASESFQKLAGIKQLGVAHLVYPGATHTRLSHSFGVFHLAKRMILSLLKDESFRLPSLEGVKAFLCAALLHDLGHFPFTHSLKELPLRTHESLTAELLSASEIGGIVKDRVGAPLWMTSAIVDEDLDHRGNPEVLFFRGLLSGVLDPDKLDYLNRDAYFCGVPYGVQDTDFVLERIHPHAERGLILDAAGIPAVENVLFSKYLMYRAVYWHRTVRIATAMIKKALTLALTEGILRPEALYGLDDEDFFRTVGRGDYAPFSLIRRVAKRDLLKTAAEIPFDEDRPEHRRIEKLDERARLEERLAEKLGLPQAEVVLDVPERVAFEVDLSVRLPDGRETVYAKAGSVFSRPVVEGFTKTLRVLRLALPRTAVDKLKNPQDLLNGLL